MNGRCNGRNSDTCPNGVPLCLINIGRCRRTGSLRLLSPESNSSGTAYFFLIYGLISLLLLSLPAAISIHPGTSRTRPCRGSTDVTQKFAKQFHLSYTRKSLLSCYLYPILCTSLKIKGNKYFLLTL